MSVLLCELVGEAVVVALASRVGDTVVEPDTMYVNEPVGDTVAAPTVIVAVTDTLSRGEPELEGLPVPVRETREEAVSVPRALVGDREMELQPVAEVVGGVDMEKVMTALAVLLAVEDSDAVAVRLPREETEGSSGEALELALPVPEEAKELVMVVAAEGEALTAAACDEVVLLVAVKEGCADCEALCAGDTDTVRLTEEVPEREATAEREELTDEDMERVAAGLDVALMVLAMEPELQSVPDTDRACDPDMEMELLGVGVREVAALRESAAEREEEPEAVAASVAAGLAVTKGEAEPPASEALAVPEGTPEAEALPVMERVPVWEGLMVGVDERVAVLEMQPVREETVLGLAETRGEREDDTLPLVEAHTEALPDAVGAPLAVTAADCVGSTEPVGAEREMEGEGEPVREVVPQADREGERDELSVAEEDTDTDAQKVTRAVEVAVSVPLSGGRVFELQAVTEAEREEEGEPGPEREAEGHAETLVVPVGEMETRGEELRLPLREGEPEVEGESMGVRLEEGERVMLMERVPSTPAEVVGLRDTVPLCVVLRLLIVPEGDIVGDTVPFATLVVPLKDCAMEAVVLKTLAEGLPEAEDSPEVARGVADTQLVTLLEAVMEGLPVLLGVAVGSGVEEGEAVALLEPVMLPVTLGVPLKVAAAELMRGVGVAVGQLEPDSVLTADAVPAATERLPLRVA